MSAAHTCHSTGRASCAPCMEFEVALWEAINRYAISVGGDPSRHVYGNSARMQAVADVGSIIEHRVPIEPIEQGKRG